MGKYLDRLREEFDTIRTGIDVLVDRAADEGRDVTPDEARQVERDEARMGDLAAAIEHYAGIEATTERVSAVRSTAGPTPPNLHRAGPPEAPAYDLTEEFPTAGDYAATLHRAWVDKDPEAIDKIERATAHQKTTDNPGLIPRPVVGPLINTMSNARPFVSSIPNRPAPTVKFDRPKVTQHVDVGKQAVEKDLTASQVMTIGTVPVALDTWAGHLNVSKQDIRWTQPSILQVIFDDFTRIYARRTDDAYADEFVAAITQTAALAASDVASIDAFLRTAYGTVQTNADDSMIDTVWMSLDIWTALGNARLANGAPAYNLPLTGVGDVNGLRAVVDRNFAAKTLITGDSQMVEFWEDLEGFLTVDEPNVLGQLVGYAGYCDLAVLAPTAFVKAVVGFGDEATTEQSTSKSGGK